MFIRPCIRNKNGKRHAYWALVESVRTASGPRQRTIAYIGAADEETREGVRCAANGLSNGRQKKLFGDVKPNWVEVDASRVRVERCREFGGPWLGLELLRTIGLDTFFREAIPSGREEIPWPQMAIVSYIELLYIPDLCIHKTFQGLSRGGWLPFERTSMFLNSWPSP